MIIPRYKVAPSLIPFAGNGLFADEVVRKGAVIIAPDNVHTIWPEKKLRDYAPDSVEVESSVRWFEDYFSLTPEWSDECYVNHSFTPNAQWHLGFIFALRELALGEEITMDYRYVIGSAEEMPFKDSVTGRAIIGLSWEECLRHSATVLATLI
jgi:hypothetical protein